jgi:hypothetical protein
MFVELCEYYKEYEVYKNIPAMQTGNALKERV